MENVKYKCYYKVKKAVWKNFCYEAENDNEALDIAKEEMERFGAEQYAVERITKVFIN